MLKKNKQKTNFNGVFPSWDGRDAMAGVERCPMIFHIKERCLIMKTFFNSSYEYEAYFSVV